MQLGGVSLPDDLYWSDEHRYTPVAGALVRSLTGVAIVAAQAIPNARPATLTADDTRAWVRRSVVQALENLAATPGATHVWLHADGRQFSVQFRVQDAPVIEAEPVAFAAPLDGTDFFILRAIKLMII